MLSDRTTRQRYNRALRSKGVPAKSCSRCLAVKSLTQFNTCSKSADGRKSQCRTCDRALTAAWTVANSERKRARAAAWHAANREREAKRKAEYYAANREREAKRYAEWLRANPEKNRAKSQRRRARKADAYHDGHSAADLLAYFEEIGCYACVYCGGPAESIDHIMPLNRGGAHALRNLVYACGTCNSAKRDRCPIEFVIERFPSLADRLEPLYGAESV
ncbi:HNH endonuclease [Streptomyces bungoensis]|uniref:HNH endonuclease n=1 Tax=Streptomyces bungoensis TaxID=285568 RepID=UPI00367451DA